MNAGAHSDGDYDVLIAGGGLVGATLALTLQASDLRVGIIEASPVSAASPPSFDDRHTALAPTTQRVFEALGLWPTLAGEAAPITDIHVSDRGHFGFTRMAAAEEGLSALGWVIPNRVLGGHLLPRLAESKQLHWYRPARITSLATGPDGVTLGVDAEAGPARLRARLLVVAEGASSETRKRLGIATRERGYGQTAIVTNILPSRPRPGMAFERFTRDGPLAVLPAPGGRWAVVWTMPPERAAALLAADDAGFLTRLQAVFGQRLGALHEVGARASYPLAAMTAERCTAQRAAIVGNAAHTLHPVAGQGFNLAIRDIATLAELIAAGDPGAAATLHRYANLRRGDYRRTYGFTDTLVRVFSNEIPVLRAGRSAALVGLDLLPSLRQQLMRRAMGRGGRLPRLARGRPLKERA